MSLEDVKQAVATLPADEQAELLAWLDRQTRRAETLRKIDKGLEQLDRGECGPVDFEDVKRRGHERLAQEQSAQSVQKSRSPEFERVPFERIKHLAGSVKGGPRDLASNKRYLDDLGQSSMR